MSPLDTSNLANYTSVMSEVAIGPADPTNQELFVFVSMDPTSQVITISGPGGEVMLNPAQALHVGAAILDLYSPFEVQEEAAEESAIDFDDPLN